MYRTERYRLHPRSKKKHELLLGTAGACRWVWNQTLARLQKEYDLTGDCDFHWNATAKELTKMRRNTPWLQDYSSSNVRKCLHALDIAYRKFFRGLKQGTKDGFPRFKGKYSSEPSFPLEFGTFEIKGEWIRIAKIGWMKLKGAHHYAGNRYVSGTVKMEANKWYAYIVYEVADKEPLPENPTMIGVDRSIGKVTLSTGEVIAVGEVPEVKVSKRLKQIKRLNRRRKRWQRAMSRRYKKGEQQQSNRYFFAKKKNAKICRKIKDIGKDWCHKTSRRIADQADVAVIEDLNIKDMTKARPKSEEKNRETLASQWGNLSLCLEYKMGLVKVKPEPTACCKCGHENRPGHTNFLCERCGYIVDADTNSALNLLGRGTASSLTKATGGEGKLCKYRRTVNQVVQDTA